MREVKQGNSSAGTTKLTLLYRDAMAHACNAARQQDGSSVTAWLKVAHGYLEGAIALQADTVPIQPPAPTPVTKTVTKVMQVYREVFGEGSLGQDHFLRRLLVALQED
jgi:hypothetical protein